MGRVKDWMMDMEMHVCAAVAESELTSISEIVKYVEKHMEPMPIDRGYVASYAKKALESMGKECLT